MKKNIVNDRQNLIVDNTNFKYTYTLYLTKYLDEDDYFPKDLKIYAGTSSGFLLSIIYLCFGSPKNIPDELINNLDEILPYKNINITDYFSFFVNGYISSNKVLRGYMEKLIILINKYNPKFKLDNKTTFSDFYKMLLVYFCVILFIFILLYSGV